MRLLIENIVILLDNLIGGYMQLSGAHKETANML